jgi:hypothetical protein
MKQLRGLYAQTFLTFRTALVQYRRPEGRNVGRTTRKLLRLKKKKGFRGTNIFIQKGRKGDMTMNKGKKNNVVFCRGYFILFHFNNPYILLEF